MNAYNGVADLDDIPSDIAYIPTMGGVLAVCGGSLSADSTSDMVTIAFNEVNGDTLWTYRYDYAGGHDGGIGIGINSTPEIVTVGMSADSNGLYDNVLVKLQSNGTPSDTVRTSIGIGIDEPRAIGHDTFGNWYVCGFYQASPINSTITIFKLDTGLNILWSHNLDPTMGIDKPTDLYVDSVGNCYVSGYVSDGTFFRSYVTRIDSNGSLAWERTYKLPGKSIQGLKLELDTAGGIMLLGQVDNGVQNDLFLARYLSNGSLYLARTVHLNGDQRATDVLADHVNRIYITGQTIGDTVDDYFTLKFDWTENDMTPVLDSNDKPLFVGDELLIRFNPDSMDMEFINNRNLEYGELYDIVSPAVITAMNQFVNFDFGRQTAFKIFRSIIGADSITTSRQGHPVRQPKLWSAMNVQLPDTIDFNSLQANLESLFPMIYYTDLNRFGEFHSPPNDPLYSDQLNLHPNATYPKGNINIEPAWDIETGRSDIKVGVIDSGVEWEHVDFQYQGNSVVEDVWDFRSNGSFIASNNQVSDSSSHGTPVAGIIGAVRNDGVGTAGIAGGHDSTTASLGHQGVTLYGLRMMKASFFNPILSAAAEAIVGSSQLTGETFGYGVHIQNCSWGINEGDSFDIDPNISLLTDAVRTSYRNGVCIVVSRGNIQGFGNGETYPACFDDKWVLNIGGFGKEGDYQGSNGSCQVFSAKFGSGVDIAGPAANDCITKKTPLSSLSPNVNSAYQVFGGTSGAVAHASGVAALLMSYLNDANTSFALSHEDVERILELSATDTTDSVGYDVHTGYGRLNAGAALQLVEKPDKKLEHHGTYSTSGATSVSFETTANIELAGSYETETFQFFQEGLYQMDRYKISASVNHAVDTADSIIAYWTRNDNVTTFPKEVNGQLLPHEECFIDSSTFNNTQANLSGYVYHVKTLSGTPIGWIPQDTSTASAKLEYTLLIHPKSLYIDSIGDTTGDTATMISELTLLGNGILIYPNPASNSQQLEINLTKQANVFHRITSAGGSLIRSRELGLLSEGRHSFSIELDDLPQGIYFHEIQIGEEHIIKRFAHF